MTFGQAVDIAIKDYESKYPESKVYEIRKVVKRETNDPDGLYQSWYTVELDADHFSEPLVSYVIIK